jgi:hypothetical protein
VTLWKSRREQLLVTVALAGVAVAFVTTHVSRLREAQDELVPVAEVAERLASGEVADEVVGTDSSYLGFDTYTYPGDEAMLAWRHEDVPYDWVGYYLPAPCHKGTTWVGKRQRLTDMGWGLAVIYVGQQTWDRTPRNYETTWRVERRTVTVPKRVKQTVVKNGKRTTQWVTKQVRETRVKRTPERVYVDPAQRPLDQCNTNLLGATRGTLEADDAIRRAEEEGFPHRSVIFLDIERMERIPQAMRDYYGAWTRRVLADGRYAPGFYTHKANAAAIYADVKPEFVAAGVTRDPPFWIAGGSSFSPEKVPSAVGHEFAAMWQGVLDVVQEWKGFKLPIDVNLSYLQNPSAPEHPAPK